MAIKEFKSSLVTCIPVAMVMGVISMVMGVVTMVMGVVGWGWVLLDVDGCCWMMEVCVKMQRLNGARVK